MLNATPPPFLPSPGKSVDANVVLQHNLLFELLLGVVVLFAVCIVPELFPKIFDGRIHILAKS